MGRRCRSRRTTCRESPTASCTSRCPAATCAVAVALHALVGHAHELREERGQWVAACLVAVHVHADALIRGAGRSRRARLDERHRSPDHGRGLAPDQVGLAAATARSTAPGRGPWGRQTPGRWRRRGRQRPPRSAPVGARPRDAVVEDERVKPADRAGRCAVCTSTAPRSRSCDVRCVMSSSVSAASRRFGARWRRTSPVRRLRARPAPGGKEPRRKRSAAAAPRQDRAAHQPRRDRAPSARSARRGRPCS